MSRFARFMRHGEEGHAVPAFGVVIGATGAVLLAIGAANDSGVLAVIGGIVLAVGLLAAQVLHHREVDYDVFRRLGSLEKK